MADDDVYDKMYQQYLSKFRLWCIEKYGVDTEKITNILATALPKGVTIGHLCPLTKADFILRVKDRQNERLSFLLKEMWPLAEDGFRVRKGRVVGGRKGAKTRWGSTRNTDQTVGELARKLLQSGEPRRGLAAKVKGRMGGSLTERHINRILSKLGL